MQSAHFNATRYFTPSFSNSAMTQSVTHGMHFANRQSIMPCTRSSLFWSEKLMKFVSIRTRYGGARAVLWVRKREDDVCALRKGERKVRSEGRSGK